MRVKLYKCFKSRVWANRIRLKKRMVMRWKNSKNQIRFYDHSEISQSYVGWYPRQIVVNIKHQNIHTNESFIMLVSFCMFCLKTYTIRSSQVSLIVKFGLQVSKPFPSIIIWTIHSEHHDLNRLRPKAIRKLHLLIIYWHWYMYVTYISVNSVTFTFNDSRWKPQSGNRLGLIRFSFVFIHSLAFSSLNSPNVSPPFTFRASVLRPKLVHLEIDYPIAIANPFFCE